jgi:hypothetical protein
VDWVSVALEEYRTLRTESLQAIEQRQRTLQIGIAGIGVITGFGIRADTETAVQAGLAAATPALALIVLVLSLDEMRRSVFAGAHLAVLEWNIAQRVHGEPPPLTWETSMQTRDVAISGYRYHRHWAVLAALFAAAAPVVASGLIRLGRNDEWLAFVLTAAAAVVALAAAIAYEARVHVTVRDEHEKTCRELGLPSREAKREPS